MSDFVEQLREVASASLLPEDGELTVPGLFEPVEILRDHWGVPYISAASLDDLWFAQGFVTAGERLFQMDLLLRAASGRLSEVFADRTLADDRFARTIGFLRTGAKLAAGWDDASHAIHARFRQGCAAWMAQMPAPPVEYSLLDMAPSLPTDDAGAWAAAFVYLAWGLSGNWDQELLRTAIAERLGPDEVGALLPPLPADPPSIPAGSLAGRLLDELPRPKGEGSNDWVVAGTRTATGKPLLANDPHLLAVQPGAWIEMHLRAPGYEARGVALTFSPGILLGTTAHHAWGVTNVSGDVQDLYVEHLNDERTAAEHDGAWEPLTVHREQIHVRGAAEPVVVDVSETRHGPIIETAAVGNMHTEHIPLESAETYALRWTGFDCGIRPSLVLDAADATSFEEFRRAAWGVECPGQNFVYADVDGTIGYQCSGRFPLRNAGDGTTPVPGWTPGYEWNGWIPFDELPWAVDPPHGYLVTANNRIHDDAYPHLIGHDFHTPYRARRVVERLEAVAHHDVASMARIQLGHGLAPRDGRDPSVGRPRTAERRGAPRDRADRRLGRRTCRRSPPPPPCSTCGRDTSPGARYIRDWATSCSAATTPTGRSSNARSCRRGSATRPVRSTTSSSTPRSPTRWPSSPSNWARILRPGDGARFIDSRWSIRWARSPVWGRSSRPVKPSSVATSRPWPRVGSTGATDTSST